MNPLHCIICGAPILAQDEHRSKSVSWLRQYRAVYYAPSEVRISGVGLRRRPDNSDFYRVPIDESKQWDDKGCRSTYVPVLTQENGKYGFVFHNACWNLLQERSQGTAIPLDRLIEVLDSVPLDLSDERSYIWEHGYQGLAWFDDQSCYPWEENGWQRQPEQSSVVQNSVQNPYCLQVIRYLLDRESISPPPSYFIVREDNQRRPCYDCFTRLPYEIVEEIASYLPTASVLNLRLVSRVFTPLFFSQIFWATRFQPDGERGFLFEAQKGPRHSRDWRSLYYLTNATNAPPPLQNRKRVWDLTGAMLQKVSLRLTDASSQLRVGRKLPEWRWTEVHGDLIEIGPYSGRSCDTDQIVEPQEALLPSRTPKVGVSIIYDGEISYIAGIQFVSHDGGVVYLGYTAPGITTFVDVTCVRGLILSVGSRGIHALQVVKNEDDGDGSLSPWLGCPDGGAITRRLVFKEQIVALLAGFDGYKLIHLAAWGKKKAVPRESRLYDLFMNHLLWFTDIPKPGVCLNEASFFGNVEKKNKFRPMCCALFGGPGGAFLPFLTGVSVVFDKYGTVDIEFFYAIDSVDIPPTCRRLRRYRPKDSMRTVHFDINGPDGELIERVDAAYSYSVQGLKISTNWGRSYTFNRGDNAVVLEELGSVSQYKRIETAPETIPIGLYACQHGWLEGLDSLGIISASLPT